VLKISVQKRFKGFFLDVEFSSDAKVTALFAPSGSGKSLTLQAVAGLVKPDRGRIEVNGRLFFDSERGVNLPPQRRRVGYLFQDYALFPHMTVIDNVRFGSDDEKLVKELLKILEIEEIRDKFPSEISGGQKQRVALARALATRPNILLLDEPFSALHKELKLSLYREIKKIQELFGVPIILVSHDIDEVFELADFLVVMEKGRVVQTGEPFNVFMNPLNLRVAKLLGHRSFLRGEVVSIGRRYIGVKLRSGVTLRCRKREGVGVGDKVFVSVLPFSLALSHSVESSRLVVLVKKISHSREFTRIEVEIEKERVELLIPSSLSPNFIMEEGRPATIYLFADFIPVIPNPGK